MNKIAIYIPAYNAATTIVTVLERIPSELRKSVTEIFIIDNHSTDNTSALATDYGVRNGMDNLTVIRNPENMGYGGSQKIAYQRCIDRGYDAVVMLHGDAQYAPELAQELIGPVIHENVDLMFGSRMSGNPLKGGMPIIRFCGNRFLTTVQNMFLRLHLTEFHSGYRVYAVKALRQVPFQRLSSDYHFDTEIIILFADKRFKIAERPIPTHYGDEPNFVNVWRYGTDVLITTISYFLHRTGLRKSKNWQYIFTGSRSEA